MAAPREKVLIYLYDLTQGMAKALSMQFIGTIPHSIISVWNHRLRLLDWLIGWLVG
jgi:hypothetical protein